MTVKIIYLRADILRSINPRLRESAQIPDFTWKLSFLAGVFDSNKTFPPKLLLWLPSLTEIFEGSVDAELEWDVNAPKGSESSKLLSGTAAKGSTKLMFVGAAFVDLISGCTTGSEVAKRSTVGEAEEMTGSEANRSTSFCTIFHYNTFVSAEDKALDTNKKKNLQKKNSS